MFFFFWGGGGGGRLELGGRKGRGYGNLIARMTGDCSKASNCSKESL